LEWYGVEDLVMRLRFGPWLVGILTVLCPLILMGAYVPGSYNAAAVAITGGTITGTTFNNGVIGGSTPAAGTFTALNSTSGALNGSIGGTTPAAGTFTTASTSGDYTQSAGYVQTPRVVTAAGAVTVTSADNMIILNKTSGAATTVNLESSPTTGRLHCVKDGKGDANTNNITITPNAGNIDGVSTFVMNVAYSEYCFDYNGTQWNIY
jgi:hypothetical protein